MRREKGKRRCERRFRAPSTSLVPCSRAPAHHFWKLTRLGLLQLLHHRLLLHLGRLHLGWQGPLLALEGGNLPLLLRERVPVRGELCGGGGERGKGSGWDVSVLERERWGGVASLPPVSSPLLSPRKRACPCLPFQLTRRGPGVFCGRVHLLHLQPLYLGCASMGKWAARGSVRAARGAETGRASCGAFAFRGLPLTLHLPHEVLVLVLGLGQGRILRRNKCLNLRNMGRVCAGGEGERPRRAGAGQQIRESHFARCVLLFSHLRSRLLQLPVELPRDFVRGVHPARFAGCARMHSGVKSVGRAVVR